MVEDLRLERKILYATVSATLFGAVLLVITISTDHWIKLSFPHGVYRNKSGSYIMSHHSGLWRICRTELYNDTLPGYISTSCSSIKLFPSTNVLNTDPEIDGQILNYSRSETAFSVISLVFSVFAHMFAFYAIWEPRYMFKRVAGMLYLFTAVCLIVTIEVLINSVNYEEEHLTRRHPEGSKLSYGFSFIVSWFIVVIYLSAAICYFVLSKKRRKDKARDDHEAMENEPVHLGRV